MSNYESLVKITKLIIMSDCIDCISVSNSEIVKYLNKNDKFLSEYNSLAVRGVVPTLRVIVSASVKILVSEGEIIKVGNKVRSPYNPEYK